MTTLQLILFGLMLYLTPSMLVSGARLTGATNDTAH